LSFFWHNFHGTIIPSISLYVKFIFSYCLSVIEVSNPVNGTVSLANNIITFTPNPGFLGNASFKYKISDGRGGTANANVNLDLIPFKGTSGKDVITGTPNDDTFIATSGRDILTGGGGSNTFVYDSILYAGNTITDFNPGGDKIVLSDLLRGLGYTDHSNAIARQLIRFIPLGNTGSIVQIDPDGSGPVTPKNFLTIANVGVTGMNNSNNFVF
jgi:hypothetical protein